MNFKNKNGKEKILIIDKRFDLICCNSNIFKKIITLQYNFK